MLIPTLSLSCSRGFPPMWHDHDCDCQKLCIVTLSICWSSQSACLWEDVRQKLTAALSSDSAPTSLPPSVQRVLEEQQCSMTL
eukprot:2266465-Amphidinium_carterae.1